MPSNVVTVGGSNPVHALGLIFNGKTASHSYAAGHADWTLTGEENECSILRITSADQAVNAIATPTKGKLFLVYNGCGYAVTVKASGQSGVSCANGVLTWLLANVGGTDFISASLTAAIPATDVAAGVVELATDVEAQTGSDTARAITSANLAAVTSTLTRAGVIELATAAESLAFADAARAVAPATNGLSNTVRHSGSEAVTAAQMHGQAHIVTGAATLTLPAVAAGLNATFVTIGTIAVSVKAGATDKITLNNTALDDGDKITNASTANDTIQIMANAAGTDWETGLRMGTWTDGGA